MCEVPISFNEKIKLIGQNSTLIKWNLEIKDETLENLYQLEELEVSRCRGILCGLTLMAFSIVQSTIAVVENTDHFTIAYGIHNLLPPVIFGLIALTHRFKYFLFRICYPLLLMGYLVLFLTTPYFTLRNAPTHFLPDTGAVYSTSIDSSPPPHSSSSISCSTGFLMLLLGSGSFTSRTVLNFLFAIAMTTVEISKSKSSYWVQSILFGIIQSGLVEGQLILQEKRRKIRFLERKKENCLNGILDKVLPVSIITARFDTSTCRLVFGAANKTAVKVLNMISEQTFHTFLDFCHVDGLEDTNINGFFTSGEFDLVKKRLNNNNQGTSKSNLTLKQICKEILMKRQAQQKLESQHQQQKKSAKTSRNSSIAQQNNAHKIHQDLTHGDKQKNAESNNSNNGNFQDKIQPATQARISTAGQSGQGQQYQQSPTNQGNINNNFENTINSLNQPGGGLNHLTTQPNSHLFNQSSQSTQKSACTVFSGYISEGEGQRKRVNIRIWTYSFVEEHVVICIEDESFKQQFNSYRQKYACLQFILSSMLRRQSVLLRKSLSEMAQVEGRLNYIAQYPVSPFSPSVPFNTPMLIDQQSSNLQESMTSSSTSKLKKSRTLDNLNFHTHFKANSFNKSPSSQQSGFQSPLQANLSQYNLFSSPQQASLPKIFLQKNGIDSQHQPPLQRNNSARNLHQPTQPAQQNFLLPPKKYTFHKAKSSDTNSLKPANDGTQGSQQQSFQRSTQPRKSTFKNPSQRLTPTTTHLESFQRLIPTNDTRSNILKQGKTLPISQAAASQDNSPRNFQRLIPVKESNFSEKKLFSAQSNPPNGFSAAIQKIVQSSPNDDFPSEGGISHSNASIDWECKGNIDEIIKNSDKLISNQILQKKDNNHVTQSSSNDEAEGDDDKKDNNLICNYACEDEDNNNLRTSDINTVTEKNFMNSNNNPLSSLQPGISIANDPPTNQFFMSSMHAQVAAVLDQTNQYLRHSRSLATPCHKQEQVNTVSIRNNNNNTRSSQDFMLKRCQFHLHETFQILNNVDCLLRIMYSPKTFKCHALSAFNMLSIVKVVLRKLSAIIEKKQLFVAVKDSKEISMMIVYTDKEKIAILLQNLIQNALHAAKVNSIVSIEFSNGNHNNSSGGQLNNQEEGMNNPSFMQVLMQKRESVSSIQGEQQQQQQHSLAARRYGKITPLECVSIPKTHEPNELKVSITNEIQVHENQGKILEVLKEYGMITPEEMINTAAQGQTTQGNNNTNNNSNVNTVQADQEVMNSRVKLLKKMQSQEYRVNSPRLSGLTDDGIISAMSHRKQRSTLFNVPEQQFQQLQPSQLPSIMTQTVTSIQSNWNQPYVSSNTNGSNESNGLTLGIIVSRNILRKIGPYEKITYRGVGANQIVTEFLIYRDLRHLELDAPSRQTKNNSNNNTGFSPVPMGSSQQGNSSTTPGMNLLNGNPTEHKSKFCSFNNNNNNNSNNYSQSNTNSQPTCQNLLSYNSENMFLHRLTKQNSRDSKNTKKKSTIIVYPEENYSKNMNSKRNMSVSNHLGKEIKETEIQGDMQECYCLESQTKLSQSCSSKQDESWSRSTFIPPERSFVNNSLNCTRQFKNHFM